MIGSKASDRSESGETLFISDLHLAPEHPATVRLFLHFLARRARRADRLYILGDLFDAWIGDDDDTPCYLEVRAALRSLTGAGTVCTLLPGNRDFLLGRAFCRDTGCTLGRDPTVIELAGIQTLLMHGDLLCTADLDYLRFRRQVRNPLVKQLFRWKSLAARRAIAEGYRRHSGTAKTEKTAVLMDAQPTAVADYLRRFQSTHLIHGHTHRPADHQLTHDGQAARRTVLAQWQPERGEVLVHRAGVWQREPVLPTGTPG
ncbi:UDP-2,3-diacylglucosamine diphosphatase [uncultured Thiodictyon sp.]|uniref:UDP-2,3-diacylglucosamine diphosphatase n=1 Tax=uncultured Thiodictyon sp. TaxID=1846217 RepID=UPI0025F754BD|nr:UDP-2,3-diacylglucosamine diphosphatase [uncultured Thiodictyon sp.]